MLDGSTCARQKPVSFADGSVWQRAPYHESRASRHYGSAARVTSVTSVSAHPKSSTPMTNLRIDVGGYVVTTPLEQAAKLTSVEDQGSMYAPRTRDHQRRTTRAGARATSSSGTQRRQRSVQRERPTRPNGNATYSFGSLRMRRTFRKLFAFRKAVAAPYSYFTPEAGGANGEGYHNFNHTFYQQPVLNVTLTTWRAAAQAAVEMRAR